MGKEKKKPGRPPLPTHERKERDPARTIRVTDEAWEEWREMCQENNTNISAQIKLLMKEFGSLNPREIKEFAEACRVSRLKPAVQIRKLLTLWMEKSK